MDFRNLCKWMSCWSFEWNWLYWINVWTFKLAIVFQEMGFTLRERQILGIHGLVPPAIRTQEEQSHNVLLNFNRWDNDLDKYIYLMGLQDRNEKLFYRVVTDNVEKMMPIIYTPTVGQACLKYGLIFRKPRYILIAPC